MDYIEDLNFAQASS